jgi:SAM-dependent methyltransferase
MRKWLYNFWYFQNPPWDTGISPPELMEFIRGHPAGRALDLGCGTGTNVITLVQHGWQVTGVDFAWRAVRLAHRKARRAGVQADIRVEDVTRLRGISGPYDLIFDLGCFHTLPPASKRAYMQIIPGLLSPGGTYLMYAFYKDSEDDGPGLTPSDLDLLPQHFTLVQRQNGTDRGWRPSAWYTFQRRVTVS